LLTIFRANRVQPVTVAPITAPLPFAKGKLDLGTVTKEQQGEARKVSSAQEAATATGCALRLPPTLPAGASAAPTYGVFEGAAASRRKRGREVAEGAASMRGSF
ncbi:MAG: hypothetical protein NTZ05_19325, partial [Chloroflexi bacterium]|nr:hypothetical protein [Chloroflexota bacterium]